MPNVCVLLANGFEEIEAVTIIDLLRRADVEVTMIAIEGGDEGAPIVDGSHGISVQADTTLTACDDREWDMVILPGGLPGATNLRDHPQVQALIKRQHAGGRGLAAICAAPIALGAAGVLKGLRATSYPGFESELIGAKLAEERVVRDGNVVTSRGVGTAIDFTLAIVSELRGTKIASNLGSKLLVNA